MNGSLPTGPHVCKRHTCYKWYGTALFHRTGARPITSVLAFCGGLCKYVHIWITASTTGGAAGLGLSAFLDSSTTNSNFFCNPLRILGRACNHFSLLLCRVYYFASSAVRYYKRPRAHRLRNWGLSDVRVLVV